MLVRNKYLDSNMSFGTAQDIFDTLTDEQKETFYYLVGWAVNNNNTPFLVCNYNKGDETESCHHRKWPIFKTFNEQQKKLVSLVVAEVLKK